MQCWWRYWGWPKEIHDIYDKAVKAMDGYTNSMHYGPAHHVWEAGNFDDSSIQKCIDKFKVPGVVYDFPVRKSLEDLLKISLEIRTLCSPYRDAFFATISSSVHIERPDPADYPPPDHVKMVKRPSKCQ